jgi:hypothetical protein
MCFRRVVIGLATLAVSLLTGCQDPSLPSIVPSGQVIYVIDGVSLTTYNVNPSTLQPSLLGEAVSLVPETSALQQIVASPNGRLLYLLWTDAAQSEHLSSFTTDRFGVPQIPAIQTLDLPAVSQLNFHPNGKFAYAMQIDSSTGPYFSSILLFHIDALGILQLDSQVQGTYGPATYPTLLYGVSPDGSQVYLVTEDGNGAEYLERGINRSNGTLAASGVLFRPPLRDSVVLGAALVVDYQNALNYSRPQYLNILSNEPEPPRPLIHCTKAMMRACVAATNVQLDPSGEYLFLTDPTARQVRVGRIRPIAGVITDTGSAMPFTAYTPGFAFSPDGTLVYALLAHDLALHIFQFNKATGNLSEGSASIPIPTSGGYLPALRR